MLSFIWLSLRAISAKISAVMDASNIALIAINMMDLWKFYHAVGHCYIGKSAASTFFRGDDNAERHNERLIRERWPEIPASSSAGSSRASSRRCRTETHATSATQRPRRGASGCGVVVPPAAVIYHRRHHPSLAAGNLYLHPRLICRQVESGRRRRRRRRTARIAA